jgi:hypothetical protein
MLESASYVFFTLHFHFQFGLGFSIPGIFDGFSQWLRRSVTSAVILIFQFSILSAAISILQFRAM